MPRIRQAILLTAAERYIVISMNFLMIAIVARLLTPDDFGLSVIGAAAIGLAECLRDFGVSGYLVQQTKLTRHETRTAFTVMAILSLLVAAVIWFSGPFLATFYEREGLDAYMKVIAVGFLAGPVSGPIMALMRRDMEFGKLAIVNIASGAVTAVVTVCIALWNASFMSFAYGVAAGAFASSVMAIALRRDFWVFKPAIAEWRSVAHFGGYSSATGMLSKAYEFVPSLVIGRVLDINAVGLYSRAASVSVLPDKCLLVGLVQIALPAMAAEIRAGRSLKFLYLQSLSFITAVQWPSLIVLAFLAHPAVLILLGGQWTEIVPLLQVMCLGLLLSFPTLLTYSLLVAMGQVRDAMIGSVIVLVAGAVIFLIAAPAGLMATAIASVVCVGVQSAVSLFYVRRHVAFSIGEMAESLKASTIIAAASTIAPAAIWMWNGFSFEISFVAAFVSGTGALIGWGLGLWWTRHPLFSELVLLKQFVLKAPDLLRKALRGNGWGKISGPGESGIVKGVPDQTPSAS